MSLFKFGFSSSENRESSSLSPRKAIRCFNRREDQRKKKEIWPRDQETIISGIVEKKNREWLIYNEEINTMHCQWCMDYAADSDKKSLTNKYIYVGQVEIWGDK